MAARRRPRAVLGLTVLLVLATHGHAAPPPACVRVVCPGNGSDDPACTVPAHALSAALPSGLRVAAIRGHTGFAERGEATGPACAAVARLGQPLSLDTGSMYGAVQVTGALSTTGTLRYEPNDGGELEFRPAPATLRRGGAFFQRAFARLKLDEARPATPITPPAALQNASCWQADATLKATDFWVVVGDSSSAGTYVQQRTLSGVRNFRACQWGGQ